MGAYIIGQVFTLVPVGANTGAVTLNVNSRGAIAVTKGGATALAAGELVTGAAYQLIYDGTRFLISNTPGRVLQTFMYSDGAGGSTTSANPTYVGIGTTLTITPKSATSILIFNISFNLQITNVAATNTAAYSNLYEGTVATPITNGGRFVFAWTTTIGASSGAPCSFNVSISSTGTTARNFALSAAQSGGGTTTIGNVQGIITEIQL
jgi:hypothetical protein